MKVEGLGEVIAVIDKESSVVDLNSFAKLKVPGCEIGTYFLVCQLHNNTREGRLYLVAVFGNFVSCDEYREWVTAVIGIVNFSHFQSVVNKKVLESKKNKYHTEFINSENLV